MIHYSVAVLGAGMSGICMGAKLKRAGITDFKIFEKADGVGGTWRANTYPGVACDVPSHLYSFSFWLNANWSRAFSSGAEILQYCEECVRAFALRPNLQFGAEVKTVTFENDRWLITLATGEQATAGALVCGVGGLHTPNIPDIPGLSAFKGPVFHSACWDHSAALAGKQVALIGTGASAVQIGPQIAPQVAKLLLFQRTPSWVLPRFDTVFGQLKRSLFRHSVVLQRANRWLLWAVREYVGMGYTRKHSLVGLLAKGIGLLSLRLGVKDPLTRSKLTPRFAVGCKRVCLADDYYSMFNRPNVELLTSGIQQVEAAGIRDQDGRLHAADVIVMATGFRPFDMTAQLAIYGKGGVSLAEQWGPGIQVYRSVMVPNFPNLFILYGPNSGTGHMSALQMIEAQAEYVIKCLQIMEQHQLQSITPKAECTAEQNQKLQAAMKRRVFGYGCTAWYQDKNGLNYTLWPYSTLKFWLTLRKPQLGEFTTTPRS